MMKEENEKGWIETAICRRRIQKGEEKGPLLESIANDLGYVPQDHDHKAKMGEVDVFLQPLLLAVVDDEFDVRGHPV